MTDLEIPILDFKHLLFELVEVSEPKERLDRIRIDLGILSKIDGEILVKGLHLILRVLLEQLAINDPLQDLHVLLEYGRVLQLVLLLFIKDVHVLGHVLNGGVHEL